MARTISFDITDDEEFVLEHSTVVLDAQAFETQRTGFFKVEKVKLVTDARAFLEADETVTAIPKSDDECIALYKVSPNYLNAAGRKAQEDADKAELVALENSPD